MSSESAVTAHPVVLRTVGSSSGRVADWGLSKGVCRGACAVKQTWKSLWASFLMCRSLPPMCTSLPPCCTSLSPLLVLVFFQFRPALVRLVCYLNVFKPSVEITAAFIITSSCVSEQPYHLLDITLTKHIPSTRKHTVSAAGLHQQIPQPMMGSGPKLAPSFRARNRDA